MRPVTYIPRYTIDDYRQWEGNWELIDGIPYSMSPSPVRRHQLIAAELVTAMKISLKKLKAECGDCVLVYELDWILSDNTVVRPDIAVVCNDVGDFITSPPILIIEILSPSTAFKDRQVKFDIYEEQGVKHYLIIDPDTKACSIYLLVNGKYVQQKNSSSYILHNNCSVEFDVEKVLDEF
jgi:Uma2 family endonuclease